MRTLISFRVREFLGRTELPTWWPLGRRAPRIVDRAGLADAFAAKTAFVSQKCTMEYCRARAGLNWSKLFKENEFKTAMDHCRWEAYAAVLGDVAEVVEILLRRSNWPHEALPAYLAEAARGALTRHDVPAIRKGLRAEVNAIESRLSRALLGPPQEVHRVALVNAKRVFDALPIHTSLRLNDYELVQNSLRFLLCRVCEDLEHEMDIDALAADAGV